MPYSCKGKYMLKLVIVFHLVVVLLGTLKEPTFAYCIYSPEIDSNGAMLNSASDLIYPSLERVVFSHRRWEGNTLIPQCTVAMEEETPAEI